MVEIVTHKEWLAKADELFGKDSAGKDWRFVCVNCGNVQSATSMVEHNPELDIEDLANSVYFSCEGRLTEGRGCNWSLGGLFRIHKREVVTEDREHIPVFLFDGEQEAPEKLSDALEMSED